MLRCLVGKWLLFASKKEIDALWGTVARAVYENRLDCSAKVAGKESTRSHVICVYNEDFTDIQAVKRVLRGLRDLGISWPVQYKPDLFTRLGVYSGNKWGLNPILYRSKHAQEVDIEYEQR